MKKLRLFDSLKFVLATVACVFAIMPAHAATLPAGYTELEYLESTAIPSQAYINTGLNFNSDYMYEITYAKGGGQNAIMGARKNAEYSAVGNFSVTYYNDVDTGVYSSTQNASTGVGLLDRVFGTKHTIKYQQSTSTLLFDNTDKWKAGWVTQTSIPYNMYLFAFNSVGTAGGGRAGYVRIYSYSVKNANGAFVQNFIPARRDSDGVLGMYDLADANPATAFHTNAGTGEFIAGEWQIKIATTKYNEESFAPVKTDLSAAVNAVEYVVSNTMTQAQQIDQIANEKQTRPDEGCPAKYCLLVEDEDGTPHWYPIAGANGVAHALPAGYTELQYIESNGQAWIDTGIKITSNDIIETEFKNASSTVPGALYGVFVAGDSSAFYANGTYYGYDVANNKVDTNVSVDTTWHNVIHNFVDGTLQLDNTTVEFAPFSFTNSVNSHLFARYYNGAYGYYFRGYVKKHKITRNGAVIIDLIPARRNNDNVVGMYDTVSGQFFANSGAVNFVAGPDM